MLGDLVSRSSLIALMYQSAHSAEHSFDEHVAIVDALERRDARAAVRLMETHLQHVERNLRLDPRVPDLGRAAAGGLPDRLRASDHDDHRLPARPDRLRPQPAACALARRRAHRRRSSC